MLIRGASDFDLVGFLIVYFNPPFPFPLDFDEEGDGAATGEGVDMDAGTEV